MNIEELADYLGVPVTTIYDWRVAGKGPCAIRVGRSLKFAVSDVRGTPRRARRAPARRHRGPTAVGGQLARRAATRERACVHGSTTMAQPAHADRRPHRQPHGPSTRPSRRAGPPPPSPGTRYAPATPPPPQPTERRSPGSLPKPAPGSRDPGRALHPAHRRPGDLDQSRPRTLTSVGAACLWVRTTGVTRRTRQKGARMRSDDEPVPNGSGSVCAPVTAQR